MEVIDIPGYTVEEKLQIGRRYLVKRQLRENGLKARQARWNNKAIQFLIEDYTREAGVRNLEREIGAVCRAVAARVAVDPSVSIAITPEFIEEVLGPPRFARESKLFASCPGVVNGLAYTPVG